ncbi:MAG: FAD-dependent oxidoreductase [Candidatus Sumerlaeaceae bacterium]|nr:FAD-dependent oxidoreductase [Candidatus Sumerlaeaceae bacterium]
MKRIHVDVAIAGAGCGGTAAAIQAARAGASVVLVEETPWAGGMITSAGVVAFDGNQGALTCGFYREVVREIEIHYGGASRTATGWVTLTAFEPHVVAGILRRLLDREPLVQVFFEAQVTAVLREGQRIAGFCFRTRGGEDLEVRARVTMDATEFGDLIDMAGLEYRLGREARSETGEPDAPETADNEIQDVTYVAILEDYRRTLGTDAPPVAASPDYNPALFKGATALDADPDGPCKGYHTLHTWETFIDYGRLPANKYMINWPFHANDFPDGLSVFPRATRREAFERAKRHTLDFVHYLQTRLGHPELGLARGEFPTPDGLPFIPYVRESRRIIGDVVMREQDVLPAGGIGPRPPLRRDSIAVGDYFLDHHHARAHPGHEKFFEEKYPSNARFQVPFGVFFPRGVDGFMAIEKSISVTHIVNGCTRLQPIVLLMGQAAGAAAAMAARSGIEPRQVPIRDLQQYLLVRGVMLYPYTDLLAESRAFVEAQRLALAGVVPDGEGFEYGADKPVTWQLAGELLIKAEGRHRHGAAGTMAAARARLRELAEGIPELMFQDEASFEKPATRAALAPVMCRAMGLLPSAQVTIRMLDMPETHWAMKWIEPLYKQDLYMGIWMLFFGPDEKVTRSELALMLDRAFDPFTRLPIG